MAIQARQSHIAAKALANVLAVPEDKDLRKKYQQLWMKFPMLVMRNGLLQTVSYYQYKFGDKPEGEWFTRHFCDSMDLGEDWPTILGGDVESYLVHTDRALEIATWYKHFVNSQYEVEDDA